MRRVSLFWIAVLTVSLAGLAAAQPFQIELLQGGNGAAIANGANLSFTAEIGQSQSGEILVFYRGGGVVTINKPLDLFGSNAFTVTMSPSPPLTLGPGASFALNVQFNPTSSSVATAQVNLSYTETITVDRSVTTNNGALAFTLQGGAPQIVFSYVLQTDLNFIQVPPGGSVIFPPTQVGTVALGNFSVVNLGTAPEMIKAISIQGSGFRLAGLPLFPVSLSGGQQLTLNVQYAPLAVQSDTGSIQVTLGSGQVITINLQGSGSGSSFTYQLVTGDTTIPLVPNGSAAFADTALGDSTSATVQIRNTGNGTGQVNSILLSGNGFQVSNAPTLPQTLAPNATLAFTVTYTPAQAGTAHGRLQIGSDSFDLVARGLGARFTLSYTSNGAAIPVGPGGSVVFSPVQVGQTEKLDFAIQNSGTQAASIANIGIMEAKSQFSLSGLPALPVNLDPDATLHFSVVYAPVTTGFANATLFIDTATITLVGSATSPPPLPAYTIDGPGGAVGPVSQPAFGLTLAAPYNLPITGLLTLAATGDSGADPAVQFSTGGQTVAFTIPANTTKAIFANQSTQIRLQTGTLAGTITLTPTFAVAGTDVTPNPAVSQTLSIALAAPSVQSASIANITATSFTLSITGFSTTRSLTDLNLAFTAAPGFNLANSQVTFHLSSGAATWFQSTASEAFGGEFSVAIPLTFQSTGSAAPVNALKTITITLANERGTSQAAQVNLP